MDSVSELGLSAVTIGIPGKVKLGPLLKSLLILFLFFLPDLADPLSNLSERA
jgi:hypothetical protein